LCYFAPNPILDLKEIIVIIGFSTVASIHFEVWRYPSPSDKELSISLSFSILMAIFPGEPVLAGLIEAKDGGGGGDNWSCKSRKAPVKSSPPTNQLPVSLQAGCPSCHPTNTEGKRLPT